MLIENISLDLCVSTCHIQHTAVLQKSITLDRVVLATRDVKNNYDADMKRL
jgi:hypothetical protein